MPTPDEISHQRELLTIYRRTLRVYLSQLAIHSMAYVPPSVIHGIREARDAIRRIKAILRGWGVAVADLPDDEGVVTQPIDPAGDPAGLGAVAFIERLRRVIAADPEVQALQSSRLPIAYLAIRETTWTIDAVALVDAQGLSADQIRALHDNYFTLLREWRPSVFLKRAWKKNGMIAFLFERGCPAEDVIRIVKQKRDSNPVLDGALTASWVIDLKTRQLFTHDVLIAGFPPVMALPNLMYPGRALIERLLAE